MTSSEKMPVRTMMVLTLPTLAFSAAYSLVTAFLPSILEIYTSSATLIGFAIGGEGIFSLVIPLWVGVLSDRIWTKRWGRRQPFMIFAAPFMAASLMLAPFQPGYVPIAVSTFVFFAAYHFYSCPYQSLLPDLTPPGHHGRVQGYQSVMRGAGMFGGLVIAGFLFGVWKPLPFLICGVFIMVVTYITVLKIHEPEPVPCEHHKRESVWGEVKRIWKLTVRDRPIRRFMVAAFLWEGTLAGLRPFIILYFTVSLKASTYVSSLLLVLVAAVYMVAGLLGGYLADKFGRTLIMRIGLWLYLVGSVLALLIGSIQWAFILLPVFCLGGAIVVTLPYAILMGIMPKEHVGGFTAMFSMVRGLANVVAPLLAGGAIDVTKHYLAGTQYAGRQYAAIWGVCGLMIVISLFVFRGGEKHDVVNV